MTAQTGRYRAYPAYKPSGVEWVGDIPESWDVRPLFGVAHTESRKNDDGREKNVLSLSYGNIVTRDVESNHGLLPASFNTYQLVEAGEIILRLTDLQNDKRSLRVGYAKAKGIITSAYLKLVADKGLLSDYFFYRLLHSYDTTKVFYGMGGGLRQSMKFEEMRRLPILLPSISEQTQIAAFLDYETAKIDALIAKQERLIALLEEKRQAVISHAVTKGLNPNAPLRPSGIDWLGDVPAQWEVCRIKHLAQTISKGTTPSTVGGELTASGVRFLKAENIGKSLAVSTLPKFYISALMDEQISRSRLCANDVLVIIAGATTGLASVISANLLPANTNQAVSFIRPKEPEHAFYILHWLSTEFAQRTIWLGAVQAAQPNLSMESLGNIPIALPPPDEMREILSAISESHQRFVGLLDKAQSAITLLKERRTALISAAVTGKIDLRDWQAPSDISTQDISQDA